MDDKTSSSELTISKMNLFEKFKRLNANYVRLAKSRSSTYSAVSVQSIDDSATQDIDSGSTAREEVVKDVTAAALIHNEKITSQEPDQQIDTRLHQLDKPAVRTVDTQTDLPDQIYSLRLEILNEIAQIRDDAISFAIRCHSLSRSEDDTAESKQLKSIHLANIARNLKYVIYHQSTIDMASVSLTRDQLTSQTLLHELRVSSYSQTQDWLLSPVKGRSVFGTTKTGD